MSRGREWQPTCSAHILHSTTTVTEPANSNKAQQMDGVNLASSSTSNPRGIGSKRGIADSRHRILMKGLRRSGKTACLRVIFKNAIPKDTFFAPRTQELEVLKFDSIIPLELWDMPGNEDVPLEEEVLSYLREVESVIFVIDINDHWFNSIAILSDTMLLALEHKLGHLNFHIFVHKMETLAQENKTTKYNDIQRRIMDELEDQGILDKPIGQKLTFHETSIYDHTIYEAFSEVLMNLIPSETLGQYENLLNSLHLSSNTKYAFLFDSKACLRISANQESHETPTFSMSVEYLKLLKSMADVVGTGLKDPDSDEAYSCQLILSDSIIGYWQITGNLCLVMGVSSQNWHDLRGTIEYNVLLYRETLCQVLELIEEHRKTNVKPVPNKDGGADPQPGAGIVNGSN